jgi:hypothetical protein
MDEDSSGVSVGLSLLHHFAAMGSVGDMIRAHEENNISYTVRADNGCQPVRPVVLF